MAEEKQLVAFHNLPSAVAEWRQLNQDALLEIGDQWNEFQGRVQYIIGAWLFVYEDALGYGAITDLAARWDRKPATLTKWKQVYKKTRNVDTYPHLGFGKMQQIARIPSTHQTTWIDFAERNPVAKIRHAVSDSKAKDDWTPPAKIESDDTISENGSHIESKSPETPPQVAKYHKWNIGIGVLEWRWQSRDGDAEQ